MYEIVGDWEIGSTGARAAAERRSPPPRGDTPTPSTAQTRPGSPTRAAAELVPLPTPHPSSGAAGGGTGGGVRWAMGWGHAVHAAGGLGGACKWAGEAGAARTPGPVRAEDGSIGREDVQVAQRLELEL